jgi:ubiquinone/menaquinone biosynthesis C-methylase UbiE
VTPPVMMQPTAALVFDQLAKEYDDVFTRSMIGRAQRDAVWSAIVSTFQKGDHILELNCGTGEDALFLARNGMSVTACDASKKMIQTASNRLYAEAPDTSIRFNLLPTERISELGSTTKFDGAFSNFSGLNCVADLGQTARDLSRLLPANAPILICLSTRFCIWEILWFLFHGKFRKAFRRCSGRTIAKIGGCGVDVYYPTVRQLKKLFSPYFVIRKCMGIGVTVPPSYVETLICNYPTVLRVLRAIDSKIYTLPAFRVFGDHMLLQFERVQL